MKSLKGCLVEAAFFVGRIPAKPPETGLFTQSNSYRDYQFVKLLSLTVKNTLPTDSPIFSNFAPMEQIIYNVTVSIDPAIEQDWVSWMCEVHIPDVMATGCFLEGRMSKMNDEEEGACTYAMTYVAYSQEHLSDYQHNHAARLQVDHKSRYEGRFAAFRSTLNVIQHFPHER